jgi:hypothetical protein
LRNAASASWRRLVAALTAPCARSSSCLLLLADIPLLKVEHQQLKKA